MPGRPRPRRDRRRRQLRRIALLVASSIAVAACSDDDDGAADGTEGAIAAETTDPIVVEITPALELSASADPDFLDEVLVDDIVTADELADAYQRYLDCLADGGAVGIYAFDLDLRVAFADWALPDGDGNDPAELDATCKRDFLGDLIPRFEDANPPAADLAERQRASTVACVAAINPAIAAKIPEEVTLDTTEQGVSVVDLQLDATALGADAGEVDAVNRCIGGLGAPTHEFG